MKNKLLITMLFFGVTLLPVMAQSSNGSDSFTTGEGKDKGDWILLSTQSGINRYVTQSECDGKNLFLFKFENTSDAELKINYTIMAINDPSFPPITKSLTLKGKQIVEGTCNDLWILALPKNMQSGKSLNGLVDVSLTINQKNN